MRDSLRKIKELRDSICASESSKIDLGEKLVCDLKGLYQICVSKGTRKKQIEKKLLEMFSYLDINVEEEISDGPRGK